MNADPGQQLWLLGIVFLSLVLIMLFSCAECVLNVLGKQQLESLADKQDTNKKARLLTLAKDVTRYLRSLRLAKVTFSTLAVVLLEVVALMYSSMWSHLFLYSLGICLVWTIVRDVLGEKLPKQLVLKAPKKAAPRLASFTIWVSGLFSPLVFICNLLSQPFEKQDDNQADYKKASWQNIVELIEDGRNNGELDNDDFEMIDGVISMHDKMAREVMVPRIDAFMIDITNDNNRSIDDILQMDYSRVPIYHEDKDKVIGIVHIKNLIKAARRFGFDHVTIRQVMQPAFFVPETITIDQLMYEMKKTQNQMAILLDEYGGVVGLVTLEDLIEEIVGEIQDESDEPQQDIQKLADGQYLVTARLSLDDFNDEFGCELEMNDVDTIGGYLIGRLGVIPTKGDEQVITTTDELKLQVAKMQGDRILDIKVFLSPKLNQYRLQREQEKQALQNKMGLS